MNLSHFNKIDYPDFWCKEWYLDMKEKGFKDEEIANDHLYVGKDVLKKWKKELGLSGYGRKDKKYVGNS